MKSRATASTKQISVRMTDGVEFIINNINNNVLKSMVSESVHSNYLQTFNM